MGHVLMLMVLVIYLPYVEAQVGTPCTDHTDCVMTDEACNPLGLCQYKVGYSNYASYCYKAQVSSSAVGNALDNSGNGICLSRTEYYTGNDSCLLYMQCGIQG